MRFILALCAVASIAHAAPLARIVPASDSFIDDAFALRADGKAVAYITTDGASRAELHLRELDGDDKVVPKVGKSVVALHWLGPARVLVVERDDKTEALFAQAWSAKGPERERLGPFLAVMVDGKGTVSTYYKNEKLREHQFASFRPDLKAMAKKAYREDKDGMVAHAGGGFRPLWVEGGLTTLVVKKEGEFDKAKDMKRPDRLARLDVLTGKLRDETEIGDVLAFVHVNHDHSKRPGAGRFAHVSDDRGQLLLVDGAEEHAVQLSRALSMYETDSLRDQALDGGRLALSLTVDPMNPPALKKKKADPAELDLYVIDVKTRNAALRLRLDTEGRPTAWQVVEDRVVLLRKNKGFDRGGVALEVYALQP